MCAMRLGIPIACAVAAALLNYYHQVWQLTPLPDFFGTVIHTLETTREHALFTAELIASPPATDIPVPVIGVPFNAVADSYGAARDSQRTHEGTDIFAPRGTPVVSATEGVVLRMGTNRLGGTIVFILGPGGERYYYAHLDEIDPLLEIGSRVSTTTLIGRVGTTGNATGTPPHLHLGIYGAGGTRNPYERLNPDF